MTTFAFLESSGLFHWSAAFAGIICLLLVRLINVSEFSMRKWLNQNLIGVIWSLFFLSLIVTLTHTYFPSYGILEAFFSGFSGTYLIFRMIKIPKPGHIIKPRKPKSK